MGIGLDEVLTNKWDSFVKEIGIRSLNLEKSLNGNWHLVVYPFEVANPKIIHSKIMKYFKDYIGDTYIRKKSTTEISVMVKPEFVKNFINAYNLRYPKFPMEQ
jgi:hypothetical protein